MKLAGLCLFSRLALSYGSWTQVSDGPSPRSLHAGAGSQDGRFWIHGGSGESLLGDTWVFLCEASAWTHEEVPVAVQGAPPMRKEHVAAWDPDRQALWLHGGVGETQLQDLWQLSSNVWTLVSDTGPRLSDHAAVWDATNGALWIHGGFDGTLKGDVWKFESYGSRWIQIQDSNPPSARAHHVAAWDPAGLTMWMHAGYDGSPLICT